MIGLVIAVFFVTYYGAGNPPTVVTHPFATVEACEATKVKVQQALDANDKVSGYSITCIPVQAKAPGGKV